MLWRSPLALVRGGRTLVPGPGKIVAFIVVFSLTLGNAAQADESSRFQYLE
jgi:hypothetical protein